MIARKTISTTHHSFVLPKLIIIQGKLSHSDIFLLIFDWWFLSIKFRYISMKTHRTYLQIFDNSHIYTKMVKTKTNLISCCSFQITRKLNSKTCQISKMKSFTKTCLKKVPSLMFVRALINAFEMYMLIFFECTLGLIYFKQNFTGKKSNSWRKTSVLETLIQ